MSTNPIQQKMRVQSLRRFAEGIVGRKNFGWWSLLYAALFFVVAGWFADGLAEFVDYVFSGQKRWIVNYKLIVSAGLLFLFGWSLRNIAHDDHDEIAVNRDQPKPVRVLGLFLSNFLVRAAQTSHTGNSGEGFDKSALERAVSGSTFNRTMLLDTTWEMPFRAIEYHASSLERIELFTSSGGKCSSAESGLFIRLVAALYPDVSVIEQIVDFEDLEVVFKAVEKLYADAEASGLKAQDVLVDITGGQKPNSIAAAIATLAVGRQFQYISTGDKVVRSYDVGYFQEDLS
jgi:hypothetical protein